MIYKFDQRKRQKQKLCMHIPMQFWVKILFQVFTFHFFKRKKGVNQLVKELKRE